jgi:ubiquitin-protein ligase
MILDTNILRMDHIKVAKRIMKDTKNLDSEIIKINSWTLMDFDQDGNIKEIENIYKWKGYLVGPPDSPYKDKKYNISIEFPSTYPLDPPKIRFTTSIFHPNISESGEICLNFLNKHDWSSAMSLSDVIIAIRFLMSEPNPDDPLNSIAANLYNNSLELYYKRASDF